MLYEFNVFVLFVYFHNIKKKKLGTKGFKKKNNFLKQDRPKAFFILLYMCIYIQRETTMKFSFLLLMCPKIYFRN